MGWKNVREHYRIGHIVKMRGDLILIGSPYVEDLLTVHPDGRVEHNRAVGRSDSTLCRYADEIAGDVARFKDLMATPDVFERSVPVYTWDDAGIVEKLCEQLEWPNVTHDGDLMYDNRYYDAREKAVVAARRDAMSGIEGWSRILAETEAKTAEMREHLENSRRRLAHLDETYPGIVPEGTDDAG
jgi:hypothetical protein